MRGISSFCVLLGLILIVTILPCFSADPNTLKEESSKYLDAVREFADNVLKYVINGFCCFDIRYTQYEIHPRRFASIAAPMFSAKTETGVSKTKQRRDSRTICIKNEDFGCITADF